MIHLFKHQSGKLKGKFDIALVVRGKYIVGSNQGYERKIYCLKSIQSIGSQWGGLWCYVQDDTGKPTVSTLHKVGNKIVLTPVKRKPSKPYQPQTIKK